MIKYPKIFCPICNSSNTNVVFVCNCVSDQTDIVRRRHCKNCNHRFYTAQTEEEHIGKVEFGDRGKIVLRVFYATTST